MIITGVDKERFTTYSFTLSVHVFKIFSEIILQIIQSTSCYKLHAHRSSLRRPKNSNHFCEKKEDTHSNIHHVD